MRGKRIWICKKIQGHAKQEFVNPIFKRAGAVMAAAPAPVMVAY